MLRRLNGLLALMLVLAIVGLVPTGCATPAGSTPMAAPVHAGAVTRVVVVSVDGLNPTALTRLGRKAVPHFFELMKTGAFTLNARTERELTLTLPNHTGMVTSLRIDRSRGGHGVTWNDDRRRPATVQRAAGRPVSSVFSVVHAAGLKTAMFASKTKFSLFDRSWGNAIDRTVIREDNDALIKAALADLRLRNRSLWFIHLSAPDIAGHTSGWFSRRYLAAVRATDARLGRVMRQLAADPARPSVLMVTSDHGGLGPSHSNPAARANYTVPFFAWGAGVPGGRDLYAMNPGYRDPGAARTSYAGKQPIRNGVIANLVTSLLGLSPVPGSQFDARHDLRVQSTGAVTAVKP